jgi:tRNA(adenine34) deaminase
MMTDERAKDLIRLCQAEAEKSIDSGNPPFGWVITDQRGNIVARDHNTQDSDNDPTAHAEIRALRELGKAIRSQNLVGYILFANASSCSMCMSGSIKAQITEFYYGLRRKIRWILG